MQVLNAAFLGSAGATAQWLNGKWWLDAHLYIQVVIAHREYRNTGDVVEQDCEAYAATAKAGSVGPPYWFPDIALH